MTLTAGLTKSCAARSGGVKTLWLADVASVTSFTLTGDLYSAVTMNGGAVFYKYEFEQDKAEMKENDVVNENKSIVVTHNVDFTIGGWTQAIRENIQEILDSSICGVIAIAETQQGDMFVMGYSENFIAERGMFVSNGDSSTGLAFGDAIEHVITLESTDNEKARTYTGTVPV